VPTYKPAAAFTFLREFVFGSNTTGLVTNSSSGEVTVVGGENATLAEDIMAGSEEIFYGSGSTMSTLVFPSATIAAWESFIQTATANANAPSGSPAANHNTGHRATAGVGMLIPFVFGLVSVLWYRKESCALSVAELLLYDAYIVYLLRYWIPNDAVLHLPRKVTQFLALTHTQNKETNPISNQKWIQTRGDRKHDIMRYYNANLW